MATTSKPKQVRLELKDKAIILKKLEEGIQAKRLASEFNVTPSAISQIKRQKAAILAAITNSCDGITKKTLHKSEYPELEEKLFQWFLQQRERHCPMNSPILKAKAKVLFKEVYPDKSEDSFNASEGWFSRFKRRFGIRYLKICGEILSSDVSAVRSFINRFRHKINEMKLTDMQIYNADESGLNYRMLPDKTFLAANEKTASGRKTLKERITILLCSNADGSHKVKPMFIGKFKKPRCFNGIEVPHEYVNSKAAWMTSKLFYNWFHDSFVKEVSFIDLIEPKILQI